MSTRILYSHSLDGYVRLGHNPTPFDARDIRYTDFRPALVKAGLVPIPGVNIPAVWGHGNDFPVYPMWANGPDPSADGLANQGCGDCEIAGKLNELYIDSHNAGRPLPVGLDGTSAVNIYSLLSGYNAQTGANDNGLDTRTVLDYAQKTGITDKAGKNYKIGVYFFAEPSDYQTYCEITYLFEISGIAWNFTDQMMNQFDAGQPWQYVANATAEGGHYTAGVGPGHTLSWTRNQGFTVACYTQQSTELSSYITAERYNQVTGQTMEHYKDADLEKFTVMAAQTKLGGNNRSSILVPTSFDFTTPPISSL
jgi:hypothetical protein